MHRSEYSQRKPECAEKPKCLICGREFSHTASLRRHENLRVCTKQRSPRMSQSPRQKSHNSSKTSGSQTVEQEPENPFSGLAHQLPLPESIGTNRSTEDDILANLPAILAADRDTGYISTAQQQQTAGSEGDDPKLNLSYC